MNDEVTNGELVEWNNGIVSRTGTVLAVDGERDSALIDAGSFGVITKRLDLLTVTGQIDTSW